AGEGKADYSYRVAVNGAGRLTGRYGSGNQGAASSASVPVSSLPRSTSSSVVISRRAVDGTLGSGPLYYTTRLHYFVPAERIAARSAGVDVRRTYLNLQGKAIAGVGAGSAVRVSLRIHTAHYLTY